MESIPLWMPLAFFAVAVAYASVGFGGGSSYLALLALVGLPHDTIPQTALVCNLIVTAGGVWHFHRAGHLDARRALPFVTLSIPLAYLGGRIPIGRELFALLLGVSLLAAAVRMLIPSARFARPRGLGVREAWAAGVPLGGALGFLSGLVGIGGGIFLAPIVILAGWASAKQAAGLASLFILVNSAAGLAGQMHKGAHLEWMVVPLAVAALLGGQIGSRLGAHRLPQMGVQRLLAGLILLVSLRILGGVL